MASRADLIMAQVRGELSQIYRKKKDEGSVIDDITAGILGYQTGQEAMYALEGAVNKMKTRRAKRNKAALMDKYSGISDIDIPEGAALTGGRSGDNLHTNYGTGIVKEGSIEHLELLEKQKQSDNMDFVIEETGFDTYEDSVFEKPLPGKPLPKPDRPMVKSIFTEEPEMEPRMMLDEEKLPISEQDVMNRTSELYLENTLDVTMSPSGDMMYPAMSESTGYNYSNINMSDIPGVNYDLDAIKATAQAAGQTRWFTDGDMSDVAPKEDEIVSEAIKKLTTG